MARKKVPGQYTDQPCFIDQLAVDFVVGERRYMQLTPAEKRHAAHRLSRQGLSSRQIGEILHVVERTVERMLSQPPPPIIDVDEEGNRVLLGDKEGQYVTVSA